MTYGVRCSFAIWSRDGHNPARGTLRLAECRLARSRVNLHQAGWVLINPLLYPRQVDKPGIAARMAVTTSVVS